MQFINFTILTNIFHKKGDFLEEAKQIIEHREQTNVVNI